MRFTWRGLIGVMLALTLLFTGSGSALAIDIQDALPGFEDDAAVPTATSSLHYGSRGYSVSLLQRNLSVLGYFKYPHHATGYYGWYTTATVKNFQRAYSLPVTGTYGPMTRRAMSHALIKRMLVNDSYRYTNVRYKWGGASPSGFDCSGFVYYMFQKFGVNMPRTTASHMYTMGYRVYKSQLQPGDLVFFALENPSHISHVGFYLGHNKFISATNSRGVYVYSLSNTYWAPHYMGARRYY
ncbi:C40 family peptidase [Tumebacillus sp. ITR2]|uniref:C40 family peptidase n=1 Tax=Tumebacillus amylolyticus TaxID=2801339 RepID=A0ABS1JCL7_9BACL|nr:NlpC/P60 family protein [Tumebacillus amylolyticus]MBL0387784.1 C40 family peptidase [Tumebacillus amylolyticus]